LPSLLADRLANAFDIVAGGKATLGIAVSGGSDSIALLVAAAEWGRRNDKRIEAATVDHGLRAEAVDEARAVSSLCHDLGVRHETLVWRPAADRHIAQAHARTARHRLLANWANARGITTLALGHTRDDRIETFLLRVRAGSGWYGLAGPLPASPSPAWPEGRGLTLVRPLLSFSRESLRDDLRRHGRTWIDDPSNLAVRHERVRMRALAGRIARPDRDRIIAIMDRLSRLRAGVMAEARRRLNGLARDPATIRLDAHCPDEAGMRLLETLLMAAGGRQSPPRRAALMRLSERILTGELGRGATLGGALARPTPGGGAAWVALSQAPSRRGSRPASGPDWDRARALLADPRLEILEV
jgi:tRNA(Ile)-lysidine synthase